MPAVPYAAAVTDWEQLVTQVIPNAAEAARDLEDNLVKSRDLATRQRNGSRTRNGHKARKLTGFNLCPRRSGLKARKKSPGPVPVPPAAPE